MALYKFTAKLSHLSFSFLKKLTNFLDAAFSGFWLGVMSQRSLDYSDELYYRQNKQYTDDKYNEAGLFNWEKPVIEKHFSNAKGILLIAAGGGREVLALSKMGFEVDGYECNPTLIEYANKLLNKNNINNKIKYLPRNSVPGEINKYDGIIIGWGAYSHIPGNKKRLLFLEGLYPFMHDRSRLMISFIWVKDRNRRDRMIQKVSRFFGFLSKKEKTEPGDKLEPDFIHFFAEEEIKKELTQSRFTIIDYYSTEYGCLIATI
jgi:protein-L-isoaspartate O-methyltransferase